MSGLNKKCEECFELHRLDCCGVGDNKEPNCYLHRKHNDDENEKEVEQNK